MKKKTTNFLKIALPLLLGVFLIWYSYTRFTPEQLKEIKTYFANANYGYLLLSALFAIFSHVSRAYRWNFMLNPMGYRPRLENNIMAVFIAYLMNVAIPRSGEVSRALVVNKYDKIPFDKAFGTIVAERVADLLILLCLVAAALVMEFDTLNHFFLQKVPVTQLVILGGIALVIGLATLYFIFRTDFPLSIRIRQLISGVKDGILSIVHMKKKWQFIAHTIFIWVMYVLMFYICIFALKETSHISFGTVITAFVVGSFTIAFTNNGFGTYPFFIAEILLLFGIPATVGTAFGWIVWISQFIMIVIFGGISLLLLPMLNRRK